MSPHPYYVILAVFLMSSHLKGDQEIILSEFREKGESELPLIVEAADSYPIKNPTSTNLQEPSKIIHQMEGIGEYKEPLVIFEIEENQENPQLAASAKLEWKFSPAGAGAKGIYELEYTIIPLSPPVDGGRMKFGLVDASGAPLTVSLHVSKLPALAFNKEGYGLNDAFSPVMEGAAVDVKIVLDLNKNTWDATVDGNLVVDQKPLPEELTSVHPELSIASIDFGSDGGWNDKSGTSYALVKVKLVRLSDKDAE